MPLPEERQPWPPEPWRPILAKYAEWAAWYSGDPEQLAKVYASLIATPTPKGRFWAKELRDERRVMLHVPIAGDIAQTSADLLFSEVPDISIPEAHQERAPSGAKTAQDRLWQLIDDGGIHNRLLEAAETAAALGGVFIGPVWDTDVASYPILRVVQADAAIPEFAWGYLRAVTLFRVIEDDGQTVWRHIERHEPGVILHGLYRGTHDNLGRLVALTQRPETAGLQEVVQLPAAMANTLAIRYVPNTRPNRTFRADPIGTYLGRSDYTGAEGLMDALDEAYTAWHRDIRLGKARGIIPEEWLERIGDKGNVQSVLRFDEDREFFVGISAHPQESIQPQMFQPAIRYQEHEQTCLHYLERIITTAGYSPQSFGLHIEGRAESGTALRIRERKSLITSQKKRRFWEPAVADVLWMMLVIDREVFGNRAIEPYRPNVALEDSIADSFHEVAQSVELLARAKAASLETRVQLLHPDWSSEEVTAEVERIMRQEGMTVPDPIQIGMD